MSPLALFAFPRRRTDSDDVRWAIILRAFRAVVPCDQCGRASQYARRDAPLAFPVVPGPLFLSGLLRLPTPPVSRHTSLLVHIALVCRQTDDDSGRHDLTPYRCPFRDVFSASQRRQPSSASPSRGAMVSRPPSSPPALPSAGYRAHARFPPSSGVRRPRRVGIHLAHLLGADLGKLELYHSPVLG
ncbi:uncharacterized protein TRAVEDRAFT_74489 [Trametes versicolor FP-101664 SS1]|uniref:uncharacterized protein n=1 Tax=Trametes versicolor (strain FP-101664) TaxID=717944 RepID=UPI0004622F3C|nr:uncharacterized protein TRAVEDRAFT_74489 [Trametes versicolor FP-101664 SS1]EIW54415.1 hypothetical protein TRAVEDRAFT_74489 [Trametes versicolor FP-101664 SS1]